MSLADPCKSTAVLDERPRCIFDDPKASERFPLRNTAMPLAERIAHDLVVNGLAVIRSAVDPSICDQAVEDYYKWLADNDGYRLENLDVLGREKRLVNFHLASSAALKIASNPLILDALDFIFGDEAYVYTSLTFKYGTQQPIHRDTPHFATWPARRFVGVWTALEDINPDAGPLMYSRGAQDFKVDQRAILAGVQLDFPDMSLKDQLDVALDRYNGIIINHAPEEGSITIVEPLKKGDTVIWHPELPHGGSPAKDPSLSRLSMVVHCASSEVHVHQHAQFFANEGETPPADWYAFRPMGGRKVALSGPVSFMS